jgi:rubrerythrin
MDKTSINELNALLKGEHMAIDGYEKYIQNVNDPNIKGELQKIQQEHKMHAANVWLLVNTINKGKLSLFYSFYKKPDAYLQCALF